MRNRIAKNAESNGRVDDRARSQTSSQDQPACNAQSFAFVLSRRAAKIPMDDLQAQWWRANILLAWLSMIQSAASRSGLKSLRFRHRPSGNMPDGSEQQLRSPKRPQRVVDSECSPIASLVTMTTETEITFGLYSRHCRGGCSHGKIQTNPDAFSTRAEWLSAHRPREIDLSEFRDRARVWRHLQRADGRYEPHERRDRVRQFHHD